MSQNETHRRQRRGLTLTELLVVVSIVVVLAGILVPLVQPILRGQKVREASRQVNVIFAGAQARAIETGRPAGIWIERAGHEPTDPVASWYTGYKIFEAEQPEPYTGDIFDAKVVIRPVPTTPGFYVAAYSDPGPDPDPSPAGDPNRLYQPAPPCCSTIFPLLNNGRPIIEPGDTIRFEGLDRDFIIHSIDDRQFTFWAPWIQPPVPGSPPQPDPMVSKLVQWLLPGANPAALVSYQPGVRFEVTRRPVKTSKTPVELPRNTGIDLSVSGYSTPIQSPFSPLAASEIPATYKSAIPAPALAGFPTRFRDLNPEYDIVIMFSPQGGIDRIHYIAHSEPGDVTNTTLDMVTEKPYFWEKPQSPVSLLIARDDEIARDINGNINVNSTDNYLLNITSALGEATLNSPENIWIMLNSSRVTSVPNAPAFVNAQGQPIRQLPLKTNPSDTAGPDVRGTGVFGTADGNFLKNAQKFYSSARSMGGR